METAEATLARGDYRAGDVIAGQLRVEALLGRGGAGAVYRVRDERTARKIALKQLRAPDDERATLLRSQFAREYHTLAQLKHPRIIEVYDYGVDRGAPYYTMELLDGEDLHERGKLPYRTACGLLRDVASSLAVLHSRGLIHRDVSARNVRCTSDGGAKLLDFGAMAQMGTSQRAVGTPPFVAPEVLQMQVLDARADLYSLGALAYWTLSGRHAYPAQTFSQLRDAWRRPPRKLTDVASDLPDALVELVLSLLRLDRDERPRTASEVMQRLSGIAGLPLQELPEVGRAYFVTPSLVGRAAALQEARAALLRPMKTGRGSSLLIEAPPGMGRSRFLDACVLEAKLLGSTVLRATVADGAPGDYGAIAALLAQLFEVLPDLCEQTAQPRAALLARVLPALGPRASPPSAPPERRHLQAALRDFFLTIARSKHLVLAVDDIAAIDEPSAAVLGALAHGAARRRLTLMLTALSGPSDSPALALLRELAERIVLEPLDLEQTHGLLGSLFGDSPRVGVLASELHPLSGGSPRQILALAEHLVSRGIIRYEAGNWTLPLELADADLPRADQEVLTKRLAALSPDARELGEALSLTDPRALSLAHYVGLTEHGDAGRAFAALDELLRAGLLIVEGDRYRLPASDVLAPLSAALASDRQRALHARLASVVPKDERRALGLVHMLRGGQELAAIEALLAGEPDALYMGRLDALVIAAQAAERLHLPTQLRLELHYRVARLSALTGQVQLFDRYAWPLIDRLRRDSGLRDYDELDPNLRDEQRLQRSIERAQARHDAATRDERGFPPEESLVRLVALHSSCNTVMGITLDLSLVERLPSLAPWAARSRGIALVQMAIEAHRSVQQGFTDRARVECAEILRELDDPAGMNPRTLTAMRLGHVHLQGALTACRGDAVCETLAAELDQHPGHRGNAWRIRKVYRLALGDLERARECGRRAELLDLQDSGGVAFVGGSTRPELHLSRQAESLTGAKRLLPTIDALASTFSSWQPTRELAHAVYKILQGDGAAALAAVERSVELAAPTRHIDWLYARNTHVAILLELGRHAEASAVGQRYLELCVRIGGVDDTQLKEYTAEALAATGQVQQAEQLIEQSLADPTLLGNRGTRLGRAYESRARVALAAGDSANFGHYAQLCAAEYLGGRSPGLRARYERLLRSAAALGISGPGMQPVSPAAEEADEPNDEARTVYSRMLTCVSPAERAEQALQLLVEAMGARTGYLFGLRSSRAQLLFSPEGNTSPPALTSMIEECLRREFDSGLASRRADPGLPRTQAIAAPIGRFVDELGRQFEPLLLTGAHHGETLIAGVAALHYSEDERPEPRRAMLDAVIEALIKEDVVDPITCVT